MPWCRQLGKANARISVCWYRCQAGAGQPTANVLPRICSGQAPVGGEGSPLHLPPSTLHLLPTWLPHLCVLAFKASCEVPRVRSRQILLANTLNKDPPSSALPPQGQPGPPAARESSPVLSGGCSLCLNTLAPGLPGNSSLSLACLCLGQGRCPFSPVHPLLQMSASSPALAGAESPGGRGCVLLVFVCQHRAWHTAGLVSGDERRQGKDRARWAPDRANGGSTVPAGASQGGEPRAPSNSAGGPSAPLQTALRAPWRQPPSAPRAGAPSLGLQKIAKCVW